MFFRPLGNTAGSIVAVALQSGSIPMAPFRRSLASAVPENGNKKVRARMRVMEDLSGATKAMMFPPENTRNFSRGRGNVNVAFLENLIQIKGKKRGNG